nr:uncharacterized protein LOC111771479 [Equus caballus]
MSRQNSQKIQRQKLHLKLTRLLVTVARRLQITAPGLQSPSPQQPHREARGEREEEAVEEGKPLERTHSCPGLHPVVPTTRRAAPCSRGRRPSGDGLLCRSAPWQLEAGKAGAAGTRRLEHAQTAGGRLPVRGVAQAEVKGSAAEMASPLGPVRPEGADPDLAGVEIQWRLRLHHHSSRPSTWKQCAPLRPLEPPAWGSLTAMVRRIEMRKKIHAKEAEKWAPKSYWSREI